MDRHRQAYLRRLLDSLAELGVPTHELTREFLLMPWQERAKYIQVCLGIPFCYRCKLPQRNEKMDYKYSVCEDCAQAIHRRHKIHPVVQGILRAHHISQLTPRDPSSLTRSIGELPGKRPTDGATLVFEAINRHRRPSEGPSEGPSDGPQNSPPLPGNVEKKA